jgi:hypothetical protein
MFGEKVKVSGGRSKFFREKLPKPIMKFENGISAQKSKLQINISIHCVGDSQKYFTRLGALAFTYFFTLFRNVNLIDSPINFVNMLIVFCVSIIFGKLK